MKKKLIIIIIVLVIFCLILFVLNYKNDKKEVIVKDNKLSGNIYYTNVTTNEYIKFISNTDYEYNVKKDDGYDKITGNYTIDNNIINLDNKHSLTLNNNNLINDDNLVFFSSDNLISSLISFKKIVSDYVDDIKKNDPNLIYPKDVKISLDKCYLKNNNYVCRIEYNIYFDNYVKDVCDLKENDKMFYPYTEMIGFCENEFIRNTKYFIMKFENNSYKLINTSNNLK